MKPKHILIIMTDQCRADALGVYGNTYAQTPAIDAIAEGAAVFNRAVTPSPVCVPARLSLLAGQYVNRTGNSNNNPKTCYTGEGFYSMLTKAGFESCCVGKMHHVWDRYGLMGFGERHTQEEMVTRKRSPFLILLTRIMRGTSLPLSRRTAKRPGSFTTRRPLIFW